MNQPDDGSATPDPPRYPGSAQTPPPQGEPMPPRPAATPPPDPAASASQAGFQAAGPWPAPDPHPPAPNPNVHTPMTATGPRRLRRSHDVKVGGVAGGIARYLGIQPNLIRAVFIILTVFGGSGLVMYLAAWLILPAEDDPDPSPLAFTSNTPALVIGFIVLAIGTLGLVEGDSWGLGAGFVLPAIIVFAGLAILNQRSEELTMSHAAPGHTRHRGAWPPMTPMVPPLPNNHPQPDVPMSAPSTQGPPQAPSQESPLQEPLPEDPLLAEAARLERAALDPSIPVDAAAYSAQPDRFDDIGLGPNDWQTTYTARPWAMTQPATPDPKPVKTGPPITSITLAAAAVVIGLLLVLTNIAGLDISATATLGAVLAVIGGGLVASAFSNRTIGLHLLGFAMLAMLSVAPLIDTTLGGGVGTRQVRVTSTEGLEPSYELGMGELVLDLSELELTEDRSVEVDVGAGYAEIRVPRDVQVEVRARSRAGYVEAFRVSDEGLLNDLFQVSEPAEGGGDGPLLTIVADVTFGYVEVRHG